MYKALYQPAGDEIVILDPQWRGQIAALRKLDEQDALVCQGCLQPVRVRAGQFRRWHFAHKHLENCPYQNQSPALLAARAVLYEWLCAQFGRPAVTLEKQFSGSGLFRPVDAWVEAGGHTFAYWIIEARLHPAIRQALRQAFEQLPARGHYLFVHDMLRPEPADAYALYLSTTEREFMRATEFDAGLRRGAEVAGMSLHYVDAEQAALTTYRSLQVVHLPQLFRGRKLRHSLPEVTVSPDSGEPVHPGEMARLEKDRLEKLAWEQRLQAARPALEHFSKLKPGLAELPEAARPRAVSPAQPLEMSEPANPVATCVFCGRQTQDWWYLDRKTGQCKCRDCLRQGRA